MKIKEKKRIFGNFANNCLQLSTVFFGFALFALIYPQNINAQEFNMNSMPPPEMHMEYSAGALKDGGKLSVSVTIPGNWHVNANEVTDEFLKPSSIEVKAEGIEFGDVRWPKPNKEYNEALELEILTFRGTFTIEIPVKSVTGNYDRAETNEPKGILQAITPNAIKIGLTQLGGFLVTKSSILIGSAFLTLEEVACYGITMQLMDILARCSTVFYQSYLPKLAQCRAENDIPQLKRYYWQCTGSLWLIFLVGGLTWIFLGEWALNLIGSQTHFVPIAMLCVMLVINIRTRSSTTCRSVLPS